MSRKNCFVEAFESLVRRGAMHTANQVWQFIPRGCDDSIDVETLRTFCKWLEGHNVISNDDNKTIKEVKSLLSVLETPTKADLFQIKEVWNYLCRSREELLKFSCKQKGLFKGKACLHHEITEAIDRSCNMIHCIEKTLEDE